MTVSSMNGSNGQRALPMAFYSLKPCEFLKLSPMELNKLLEGYEKRRMDVLWLASYFTANLMGTQIKNISPEKLMEPFLQRKARKKKNGARGIF